MNEAAPSRWRRALGALAELRARLSATRARITDQRPRAPPGYRLYAIGDIHGQTELLKRLLHQIEADHESRPEARTQLILLGDFIDRGGGSARLLTLLAGGRLSKRIVILKGNHEAALVDGWRGSEDAMQMWLRFGGAATLAGFGVDPAEIDPYDPARMIALARAAIPAATIDWLAGLPLHHWMGDYYFVHAGVRPGVRLRRQRAEDQLWIRGDFLDSDEDHGAIVVHGHSIYEPGADIAGNRIGLDTGAYRTGRLTALGIEGTERWFLMVDAPDLIMPGAVAPERLWIEEGGHWRNGSDALSVSD